MPSAIEVENVTKQYRLGSHSNPTLQGALQEFSHWTRKSLNRLVSRTPAEPRVSPTLMALNGVSMNIQAGEIVGIVGRNGNGKSTLLKILSRITMPTSGKVRLHGSVASLLEVGTGFHPELSGRENIFLNGAILGMSHKYIKNKLDEIVAFSEVEKFLDTPVKRYSSGMYVRLAFAVAAHLEPDILLVDEVLAVGDGAFQKKCLGKMESVGRSHRTVLFVSHSLSAIRSICTRVILIDSGKVIADGPTEGVLAQYNKMLQAPRRIADDGLSWRLLHSNGAVRVAAIQAGDGNGTENWTFKQGQDVRLCLDYEAFESVPSLGVYVALTSLQSGEVVTTIKKPVTSRPLAQGTKGRLEITFPKIPLRAGEYSLTLALGDDAGEKRFDYLDHYHNLPWLCIRSDEKDLLQMGGYFCIPAEVAHIA